MKLQINGVFLLYFETVFFDYGCLTETYCIKWQFVPVGKSGKDRTVDKAAVMFQYLSDFLPVCAGKIS